MCLIKQRSMQEGKKYLTEEEQDRMTERGTFRRLPGMTSLSLEIKEKVKQTCLARRLWLILHINMRSRQFKGQDPVGSQERLNY